MKNQRLYIKLIWLSSLVMLAAIFPIMPTFDAWTTTSAPNPYPLELKELLPQGEYWRPWDVLYSHFLGIFPEFFPYLNHLFIGLVHIFNCIVTYVIAKRLGMSDKVSFVALVYVFVCPAMLGVVVDVDSIHQVAALAWGLLSLYVYLGNGKHSKKVFLWISFVLIGTLAKESCFSFMLITPFIAWGFKKIGTRQFWKDISWAVMVVMLYMISRFSLNEDEIASEYISLSLFQFIKNCSIFILFHIPVIIIILLNFEYIKKREIIVFLCCILFSSVLHLASVYATMHTYVSLPFAALIFAFVFNEMSRQKVVIAIFLFFSIAIDCYLTKKTYDSGELGLRLAQQAVLKTSEPVDSVYTVSVATGPKGFSTFIVRDYNAFAWGLFSKYLNDFRWPLVLKDTTLYDNVNSFDNIIEKGSKEGFKTFWIVRGDSVQVISKK